MRDARERLKDILDAIRQIFRYSAQGKAVFEENELIQTWIIHHLEIIGEAASRIDTSSLPDSDPIPWPKIVAMRNLLAHEYFGIDLNEVWQAVEKDLPILQARIAALLEKMS